jgi:acetyl-CoA carboxylase carboxyltransferase component
MIGSEVERQGIIRHGAKMLFAVGESRVPRIAVLVRKAYGGGYLAMSGSPMHPDAVLALATAKPALMGPDAAVNGIYYNHIQSIEDPDERRRFVEEKQAEYAAGVDVFKIANENAIEAIVPGDELRDELIARFSRYRHRRTPHPRRNNPVTPA